MIQKMAWAFGIFFILVGILGFIPIFLFGGLLFGAFTIGMMHNIGCFIVGALALLAASKNGSYPRLYFKVFGILFSLATIVGFTQGDTILGIVMVNTADNLLHLVIAAVMLWAGFGARPETSMQPGVAM